MTREEAIEIVKSAFSAWESEFRVPNDDWSEEHEALDMAIEALSVEPTMPMFEESSKAYKAWTGEDMGKTEPSDLISRADAINAFWEDSDIRTAEVRATLKALPSAEAVPIHEDGTLEVKVPNAHKVGRVLVMDTDSHIGGGLFYPDDTVYGEWQRVDEQPYFRKHYHKVCCSVCHKQGNEKYNFCPNCGARMKGGAE